MHAMLALHVFCFQYWKVMPMRWLHRVAVSAHGAGWVDFVQPGVGMTLTVTLHHGAACLLPSMYHPCIR